MKIYNLAFLLLLLFTFASNDSLEFKTSSSVPDCQQEQKSNKTGTKNIVFKSTDGGKTCQDIREGLSGKLEKGGFSLSRKIRIYQVFYQQDPGQTKKCLKRI